MLKYRIEFIWSPLRLAFQLLTYAFLVFSVLSWQVDSFPYQWVIQFLLISILSYFVFKSMFLEVRKKLHPIILSQDGEWLETDDEGQNAWLITDKSRVSSFMLFIHLVSPLNVRQARWCLVFRDQVPERNFRRLCRAVIYQQQSDRKS